MTPSRRSRNILVGIKGPLTTPVGGGIRSLNVALRQMLDLYVCLRPVQYFTGVPSPVKNPEKVDMVIFRENTEDIYAGIDFEADSEAGPGCPRVPQGKISRRISRRSASAPRQPGTVGIGIKPVSKPGTERLVRAAIKYAIDQKKKSVTIVHKGNIMKYTEGAFRDWGYDLAKKEFGAVEIDGGPWCKLPNGIIIKDAIADITLQQVLTRAEDFDVIATLNLNGDYLSDALAAQVGGIGIAPGGNSITSPATRSSRRPTAPRRSTPTRTWSTRARVVLSGEMMFRYLGWSEAADLILKGLNGAIAQQESHLRFRPPDGRRDEDLVLRVRRQHHRPHVSRSRAVSAWSPPPCGGGYEKAPASVGGFFF